MNSKRFLHILGKKIRSIRKNRKVSQEKLAELAGLHPTYISNIEQGKVNASLYSFFRISEALGIPFTELVRLPGSQVDQEIIVDSTVLFSQLWILDKKKQVVFLSAAKGLMSGIEKS